MLKELKGKVNKIKLESRFQYIVKIISSQSQNKGVLRQTKMERIRAGNPTL